MAQDFVTTTHAEYIYPYDRPIAGRPCEPPIPNPKPAPVPPPVPPYCHCDAHSYDPLVNQYAQLVKKRDQLCEDYEKVRKQMTQVTNDILDHPCDDSDSKMATIYQIDYKKRAFPVTGYRALTAAAQATAEVPQRPHRTGRAHCHVDPTTFLHTPVVRPSIEPPRDATLQVQPAGVLAWFAEFPGRTEYQDTYAKCGKAVWRSSQRYREPMPSTRRREDDPCL